jgi:hypothetical protein
MEVRSTDPTNWMSRVEPSGAPYRYRYVGEGGPSIENFSGRFSGRLGNYV